MNYYKIDRNGYAVMLDPELPFNQRSFDSIWLEEGEEIPENYILAPDTSEQGLHHPRWTGIEWVEGKTQQEFEHERLLLELIPTQEEIKKAELQIQILEILQEVMI